MNIFREHKDTHVLEVLDRWWKEVSESHYLYTAYFREAEYVGNDGTYTYYVSRS